MSDDEDFNMCFLIWMVQALGIKGKMFAKKRYAEKAQLKKT